MTELEQQLTNALTALSKQYEAEMGAAGRVGRRIAGAGAAARRIGQGLEAAARDKPKRWTEDLKQQVKLLRSGLQGDRRSIARGCERYLGAGSNRRGNGSAGRSETMAPAASNPFLLPEPISQPQAVM